MSEYGFLHLNGVIIDELDVKEAFEMAEDRLDVLDFEISDYVMRFTLRCVLCTKNFSHLSKIEKNEIVNYIVEYY